VNRQVLASEALRLSRTALQRVPTSVRIASIAEGFLRQAFTRDDMALSIGLHALLAMEKAGTTDLIEGKTSIDELRPWIKRNALAKLKGIALRLGSRIFSLSMAGKNKISLPIVEEAWGAAAAMLERHPVSADKSVGQVLTYIANALTMRIKDVLKTRKRRVEIEQDPDFGESTHREPEPGMSEVAVWKEIERRFKSDPDLLGPKGEPWAWLYIEGRAGGLSESEIVEQWNEASRRSGGDGSMNRSMLVNWLRNGKRRAIMQELTKRYLDEATVERLKLAVARGALRTAMLQPFQREILELLAA
jgi:hypothetical protein